MNYLSAWLDRWFSEKYINKEAVAGNPILLLMYRAAYSPSFLLNAVGLTPNQITLLSIVFSVLAAVALVSRVHALFFIAFWCLSVLFDFCDGTVARMSNRISRVAFQFDHMSDLFKISLIVLASGIEYDDKNYWILIFIFEFLFLFGDLLNYQIDYAKIIDAKIKKQETHQNVQINVIRPHKILGINIKPWMKFVAKKTRAAKIIPVFQALGEIIFTFNGHSLLIFLFLPFGILWAKLTIIYFLGLLSYAVQHRIRVMTNLRRK